MKEKNERADACGKGVSGTGEWARQNLNIMAGCEHDCRYCYAKGMAIRFCRSNIDSWKNPRLNEAKVGKKFSRRNGTTMFPTTHDITPEFIGPTMDFLENLLRPGNRVLIVTKPHLSCVEAMCARFGWAKGQILFRFTIGSTSNDVLSFWEPHAPAFEERMASLEHAFRMGFSTSVSCEPMLDGNPDRVLEAVAPFVTDSVWLGKANMLKSRMSANGHKSPTDLSMAEGLIRAQSDEAILALYERLRDNPKVKWKESIKKLVGLDVATEKGLDV